MSTEERPLHYVCTGAEAWDLTLGQERFWVGQCGCRQARGGCARSRSDVCLQFRALTAAEGRELREISRADVEEILQESEEKRLVARPFRDLESRTTTEGICFCCDDCCGYFLNPEEKCDPGAFVEMTVPEQCNDCLACVDVCHFGARTVSGGELQVDRTRCYGCGLCADVCSLGCVSMIRRS